MFWILVQFVFGMTMNSVSAGKKILDRSRELNHTKNKQVK